MNIVQSLEDIKEEGPYLISGRVCSIEDGNINIVIKDNLTAQIYLPNSGVIPDDYISVKVEYLEKVEEIGKRFYISASHGDIIKDISYILSVFRKHYPSIQSITSYINDNILLCILKQFLYREITIDCPTWEEKGYFRIRYHTSPSALTYHHAYIGGNYIHSIGVASLSINIANQKGVTGLPLQVLITGALLHDIGKLLSFTPVKRGDLLTVRPTTVEIKQHIDLGIDIIDKVHAFLKNYISNKEKLATIIDVIKRLIETHHGLKSWGAKREPESILEQILFVADYLDSRTGSYNPLNPIKTDYIIQLLDSL